MFLSDLPLSAPQAKSPSSRARVSAACRDDAAGLYEREVDHGLKNLSSAIEPILIVVVGGMVLLLAFGISLPLWEMIARAGH